MTGIYTDPRCLDHAAPEHPERPERVRAAVDALRSVPGLRWPEVRPAEPALVARVHEERLVRGIHQLAESGGGWIDADTFVVPASFDAALMAAGATLQAVADVLGQREQNAFVPVRPPGHHARHDRAMGFCLFNSIAVAARWALDEGGARKVAILDVDVHHGNGTQDIFWETPEVLYYSTHQFPFYPGTGRLSDVGGGEGAGATVNVPLVAGCGDATFLAVTDQVLVPMVRRFEPDVVLVSLGFDAHWADPLAQMELTTAGYTGILARINALADELCGGRIVLLLEGGYDLGVIAEGSRTAVSVLNGEPGACAPMDMQPPTNEPAGADDIIARACAIHD